MHMSNCWQLEKEGKTSERWSEIIDNGHIALISKVFEADNDADF